MLLSGCRARREQLPPPLHRVAGRGRALFLARDESGIDCGVGAVPAATQRQESTCLQLQNASGYRRLAGLNLLVEIRCGEIWSEPVMQNSEKQ